MKLINKIKLIVLFAVMLVASLCIAACSGNDNDSVKIPDYPSKIEGQHNTYTDLYDNTVVTVDGTITEAEWAGQNKWEETISISNYDHHIEIWSRFTEEGVVMAYRVTGAPAYYNAGRGNYANSGIEIYIANGKATTAAGNQWEMEFFANGAYHTSKYIKYNGYDGYASSNSYVDIAGRWLDKNGNTTYVNNPENNGYEDEVMIPWYSLGGKCDSIVFNAAIQYMASETATSRSGYVNMLGVIENDYYWTSCQNWRRFDKDGYYDKSKAKFAMTPYDVGVKAYNDGYAFTEHGWNNGNSQLYYNTPVAAGEDYILTAKLYAPHLAHEEGSDGWNENYAKETNYLPQGQGGTETAYNGLSATRNGQKIELAFQKGWGSDGVFFRWNGSDFGWTSIKLSSAQLEKYMTEGLNVGMYVKGNVVTPLLENDAGELVMLDGGMVKTVDKWATAGETKLGIYYQCDTKFDQWNVYAGEAMNGSLTVIDETESGAHGSVTAVGRMYDSVTINVTPEEGYELASLLVDGVEYAARVENNVVTAKVTGTKATVKATFRTAINQAITLNVTRKFAYEAKAYSADGSEIILTDAEGKTYTGLVANGQVTVKIVDGTYTLTAKGCANATPVTVENGQASITDVVLLRKLFNDVDNTVTAVLTGDGTSETGATLKTTQTLAKNEHLDNDQWKLEKNIDFSGKVVLVYTLSMSKGPTYATIGTNRHLYTINQGDWTFGDGGFYDAPNNVWADGGHILHKGSATFMAIFDGNKVGLYYQASDEWKLIADYKDKNEGELTSIIFTHGEHADIITWSDIKVYDGERADEILKNTATLVYDNAVVDATISKTTSIEKDEEVTVTASVKDPATHQIASVTVNGTALTAGEDGTYKFTATGYMGTYNVVVTAETLATELTFTTTHKFAYEKAYYNLPDGTELSFVSGSIVKNATVANGKVTISLSAGTYTVNGLTVVVTNGAVESTSLEFTRELVKTSNNVTITANDETGLSYTNEPNASLTIADVDMTNNVLVFDARAQYDGNAAWADLLVEPYAWNSVDLAKTYPNNSSITENVGYRVDWLPNQNGSQFQLGGNKNGDHAVRTTKNWTTVLLRTVITDGTAKTDVYIGNLDGTYSLFGYLGKNNADASAMFYRFSHAAGASNEVKNIKVYDGERATAYFDGLTKIEASNATVDGVTLTGSRYADLTKYESEKSIVVYPIASNQAGCNNFSISSEEKIVAMTYNMQILDKTFVGTKDADGAWMTFDKTDGAEIVHQMKDYLGYRFRYDWGTQAFADNYKTAVYEEGGAKFALYLAGNTGNYLTVGADGVMYNSKSVTYSADKTPTAITGIRSAVAIKLTDVKFYTQAQWNEYLQATAQANVTVVNGDNGEATANIVYGGNLTVTVTPDEGYILDTLKVNGANVTESVVDGVYTQARYTKLGAKIEATFKLKPATEYTFNVSYKYLYETEYYAVANGTVLVFANDKDSYQGTVNNGKVTVALADGTYTVNGVAVTVANGNVESTDLQFTRTLFSAVDETVTAKFTAETATAGATLQTTVKENVNKALDDKQWKIENFDNTGKVVLLYTLGMGSERECYATIGTNRHIYAINQGHWNDTTGYYDAPNNKWTVGVKHSEPTSFMAIFEGRAIQLYYKVNGVWTLLADYEDQGEGELKSLTFTTGQHSAIITWSDIKVYDGARVDALLLNTASVAADSSEQAEVVLSKTTAIAKGEEVTATVTLKDSENYQIVSVSVNGTVLTGEAGVYKFNADSYASNYVVKVVTEATAHEVAATAQYKYAYESDLYNMADGTELTFTSGSIKKTATVKDGKLTIALSNGEYTVSGDRIQSFALVVTDETTTAKLEAKRLTLVATDESKMTITEDENGATVTFNGKTFNSAYALLPTISGKTVITGTYVGAGSWDDSINFMNADGSKKDYLLNVGTWGDNVFFKWRNDNKLTLDRAQKDYKNSTDNLFHIRFAIVVDGDSITTWTSFQKATGEWEAYESKTFAALSLSFGFASGGTSACSFNNVTIAALTGDYNPNN